MRSGRPLAALVAAIVGVMLSGAPPAAHADQPAFVVNPINHVDTLIGTGTGGETVGEINNFPGARVPFGMVQYSPDTTDTYAGYDHDNARSTGFSMTHASVGCAAFGDISMLPTTTPIGPRPWTDWEEIAHDGTEVGVPGYYTVRFPATGVTAELTATTRTGVGRFSYPANGQPALFHVRSGASLGGNDAATIQIGQDHTTITGSATTGGFCGKNNTYTVYFAMEFSRPFTSYGTWDGDAVYPGARSADSIYSGGYVEFPAGSVLEARTAISYVSVDGARANLAAEGERSFDEVRAAALAQWNAALARITVAGTDSGDLQTFYTSLYRTLLHPNTFNDTDGRYIGFDGTIHTVAQGHTQYANFSDWDTYGCLAALQALLFPAQASDSDPGSPPTWSAATHPRRTSPRRPQHRRRLDHAGVVARRLHHLPVRRRARRHRDRCRVPEPGAVLAEPVQSGHRLPLAPRRRRRVPPRAGLRGASLGLRPGRIRRGQRRAIPVVGAAECRLPGDRSRRPPGRGRPARPLPD